MSTAYHIDQAMDALARKPEPGRDHHESHTMPKYGPAVLLALAALLDRYPHRRQWFTAAELRPYVGLGVSTVSATLLELHRDRWLDRHRTPNGYGYTLSSRVTNPTAAVTR